MSQNKEKQTVTIAEKDGKKEIDNPLMQEALRLVAKYALGVKDQKGYVVLLTYMTGVKKGFMRPDHSLYRYAYGHTMPIHPELVKFFMGLGWDELLAIVADINMKEVIQNKAVEIALMNICLQLCEKPNKTAKGNQA